MYCSLAHVSFVVHLFARLVLSLADSTDNSNALLSSFDTEPSPFLDANQFWTADATPSCAGGPDQLSLTNVNANAETSDLFSRDDPGAQCLPPVNIGAEALQLFESPLNTLENSILPLKDETPLGPSSIPDQAIDDPDNPGWKLYRGPVHFVDPLGPETGPVYNKNFDNQNCALMTGSSLTFVYEVCCNSRLASPQPTLANDLVDVIADCIRTFVVQSPPVSYS